MTQPFYRCALTPSGTPSTRRIGLVLVQFSKSCTQFFSGGNQVQGPPCFTADGETTQIPADVLTKLLHGALLDAIKPNGQLCVAVQHFANLSQSGVAWNIAAPH